MTTSTKPRGLTAIEKQLARVSALEADNKALRANLGKAARLASRLREALTDALDALDALLAETAAPAAVRKAKAKTAWTAPAETNGTPPTAVPVT